MNQAQGAIDAARAAGADRFAASEFAAAVDALARSEQAVSDRDYRLALGLAIDSRERAQNAAKISVDVRANSRGEAERAIAEAATLLRRTLTQLEHPDLTRVSPRALRTPRATTAAAEKALQEARSALEREDYPAVAAALGETSAQLQAALSLIDAATASSPPRRKR